ncbi:hypothetical protein FOMPIDRAFT_90430 [Fomitopsis schrenkii]|uniref:Uncharacterized protein n=1 Tax=Fomitopsis schrenkii TaxID=2126942 RepID=S8E674_FOMSC|nr:hypothetical protein FOMPIDRAFT_90430 [Fomitopsis schrenkii]
MSAEVLLRFIELFGSQYPRIREVNLSLRGTMSSALHHVIEELARSSGPDLESFSWDSCRDKETLMQSSPRHVPCTFPPFAENINLRSLCLLTAMPSRQGIPWVYRNLTELLPQIKSPHLQDLTLQFSLDLDFPLPWAEEDLGDYATTPDAVAAFQALLRRPVFDEIPRHGVHIAFDDWRSPDKAAVERASAEISRALVPLFAPWLEREVTQLEIPGMPNVDHTKYNLYIE